MGQRVKPELPGQIKREVGSQQRWKYNSRKHSIMLILKSTNQEGDVWRSCLPTRENSMMFAEVAHPLIGCVVLQELCMFGWISPCYIQGMNSVPLSSNYTLLFWVAYGCFQCDFPRLACSGHCGAKMSTPLPRNGPCLTEITSPLQSYYMYRKLSCLSARDRKIQSKHRQKSGWEAIGSGVSAPPEGQHIYWTEVLVHSRKKLQQGGRETEWGQGIFLKYAHRTGATQCLLGGCYSSFPSMKEKQKRFPCLPQWLKWQGSACGNCSASAFATTTLPQIYAEIALPIN